MMMMLGGLEKTDLRESGSRASHAVVIGASLAGLLAARVLSECHDRVTIVDRNDIDFLGSDARRSHLDRLPHALLPVDGEALSELLPDIVPRLLAAGGVLLDPGHDVHWHQQGGAKARARTRVAVVSMSGSLLDSEVLRMTLERSNITPLFGRRASGLLSDEQGRRVRGVLVEDPRVAGRERLVADLVVDASGRASRAPTWLISLGYGAPERSEVRMDLTYATRLYRRDPRLLPESEGILVCPSPPLGLRAGVLAPVEQDQWAVTLAGWLTDRPARDAAGFAEFARTLPSPEIHRVISAAEPTSDVFVRAVPSSLRVHFERLRRLPGGFLVLGGAMCSLNPVYAQGFAASILQALALRRCLQEIDPRSAPVDFTRRFFDRAASAIDSPWSLVAAEDLRFDGVKGPRGLARRAAHRYMARFHEASLRDPALAESFLRVLVHQRPMRSLASPRTLWRVAVSRQRTPFPPAAPTLAG
jgi:flavin-dependent dehydrogenase